MLMNRLRAGAVPLRDLMRLPKGRRAQRTDLAVIVGAGRSGTHWVARTLASHDDVTALIEADPLFSWVRAASSKPTSAPLLMPRIIRQYQSELDRAATPVVVDKSHPALFLAPALLQHFPTISFIAVRRRVEAVVASGMRHGGVRRWVERPAEIELPNPFLGVSKENMGAYRALGLPGRLAVRWAATNDAIDRLRQKFPAAVILLQYEDLHVAPAEVTAHLTEHLALSYPLTVEAPAAASFNRWQTDLAASDLDDIAMGLSIGRPPPFGDAI